MRRLTIFLLRGYQYLISPLFPPSCRFWPNCSAYSIEAVEKHGPVKGLWLSVKRVARCNPWGGGGIDTVPDSKIG
ncbi:MAG: membrane protein insertion efficiency factor YidD [Acidiferrobacteraceae bacterium]|nr:membrane protein insertion efficiency factor YidD [Acidiferrobacteraceae bacterium]